MLAACARAPEPERALGPMGLPDREGVDVALSVTDDALPRARIQAPHLYAYDDSLLQVLTRGDTARVHVSLFDADGQPSGTLVADTLYYYDQRRRMDARGEVVVVMESGRRTLRTDRLSWLEDARRIEAPGLSRLTAPGTDMRGYVLVADETLTNYAMERVSAQIEIDEDGNPIGER